MKPKTSFLMLMCVLATLHRNPAIAAPLGTAFTYQGQLVQNGSPVTNTADFQFTLWDSLSAGIQVAGPTAVNNVSVANGQFTASIDFGSFVFNGDARWLQIAVRSPAGGGAFTTLSPRQPLTAVPYALQTRGMFVNAGGNVGIGTTNPAAALDISRNWDGEQGVLNIAGDKPTIRFTGGAASANQSWIQHLGGDGRLEFYRRSGPAAWQNVLALNTAGNVGIGTAAPLAKLHIANGDFIAGAAGQEWSFHTRSSFGGDFLHITDNDAGVPQFQRGLSIHQNGVITSRGEHLFNNTSSINVGAINPDPPPGSSTFPAGTPTMRAGAISMYGPAGRTRFGVWSRDTNFGGTWFPNQAHLFMDAADGNRVISIYCAGEGGAAGSSGNIVCTNFLATGSKNFLVPNPDNPAEDITYACLEGPECGMYMRGTAELNNGKATVRLPATFSSLASQEGLTVILTPLSGDSLGLACVNRTIHGFEVVELMKGDGRYEFDWEVKAIRRGTRDYQVVHPWTEHAGGAGSESEVWERRLADIERRNAKFADEDAEIGPRPEARPAPLVVAD